MTGQYTRPKTVRFEPDTWRQIEKAAIDRGITTSVYIRNIVESHVEVS
jgi:predicted DNA-binding ribbon-helix-helix protein